MLNVLIAVACIAITLYVTLRTWPLVPILAAIAALGIFGFWVLLILIAESPAGRSDLSSTLWNWLPWILIVVVFGSVPASKWWDARREARRGPRPEA